METDTERQVLEKAMDRLFGQMRMLIIRDGKTFDESVCLATTVSAYVICKSHMDRYQPCRPTAEE